ncbi:hypothetical protein FZEAL_5716 [Fusarium zealandicum]|uniref:Uncharacterized protein n=1 Tax=Fusarium zealandicum TaxID=1053134 RepID=A0A8H4UJ65_9HYPO|nr:hypothetical protein FZEAL_5716 [Fusarium zealandicum]
MRSINTGSPLLRERRPQQNAQDTQDTQDTLNTPGEASGGEALAANGPETWNLYLRGKTLLIRHWSSSLAIDGGCSPAMANRNSSKDGSMMRAICLEGLSWPEKPAVLPGLTGRVRGHPISHGPTVLLGRHTRHEDQHFAHLFRADPAAVWRAQRFICVAETVAAGDRGPLRGTDNTG